MKNRIVKTAGKAEMMIVALLALTLENMAEQSIKKTNDEGQPDEAIDLKDIEVMMNLKLKEYVKEKEDRATFKGVSQRIKQALRNDSLIELFYDYDFMESFQELAKFNEKLAIHDETYGIVDHRLAKAVGSLGELMKSLVNIYDL